MTGVARLYTRPEVLETQGTPPRCELDLRFLMGLGCAVQWVDQPTTCCSLCNAPLNRKVAYWVVLLPSDPELGLGISGGVCSACGMLPRTALEEHAERAATLLFEEVQGHG